MESIGDRLRSVRESKKLTIRDVAKDTNIAPRYIEALENEEFERFPGETYITGFLRSYAEYLKMDADDLIQSYKGYKIGESVTPLEELTKPTGNEISFTVKNIVSGNKNLAYGVIGVVVLVAVIAVWSYISSRSVDLATDDSIDSMKSGYSNGTEGFENIKNLKLAGGKEIVLLDKDEAAQFLVESKEVMFVVREIKEKSVGIEIFPEKKTQTLTIDMPTQVVFKGTTKPVKLTLKGATKDRANIKIELTEDTEDDTDQATAATTPQNPLPVGDQTKATAMNAQSLKIVFEADFTAKTYIEVYLDGSEKTRGVVLPGRKERWEANQLVQIKIGNAGGVKARVNGKEYSFGLPGQVANKVITWKKDAQNPNQYQIVVRDWY